MYGLGAAMSPQQLESVNKAIAAKVDGGGTTLEQLLNLPTNRTFFNSLPKLADGNPDLRFLPGIGSQMELTQAGWKWNVQLPDTVQSVGDWINANQTWVLIGAGALVLLAVMGGRRR